jgi:hypothetical protein
MLHYIGGSSLQGEQPGQRKEIFLLVTTSRPTLEPTEPLVEWIQGALSSGIKQMWHNADHSPPSNTEVKKVIISGVMVIMLAIRPKVHRFKPG